MRLWTNMRPYKDIFTAYENDKDSLTSTEWMYLRLFYEELHKNLKLLGKKYEIVLDSVEKTLQDVKQYDEK